MKQETKLKLISDSMSYTAAVYVAQFIGMFVGLATRYFLEPAQMGVWVLFQSYLAYALLCECGILTSMYFLLPKLEARGEKTEEKITRDIAFTFVLVASVVLATVFVLVAWMPDIALVFRLGLVAVGAATILTLLYNFYVTYLWASSGFKLLSRAVILNAVLQAIFTVTAVRSWGLRGLYLSMIFTPAASLLFLALKVPVRPQLNFNFGKIWLLIKLGAPIYATGAAYVFFMNLDRFLIARGLRAEDLGHYSLALVAFSFASIAPKMFSIVLFPRIQAMAETDKDQTASLTVKFDRIIAFFLPVALAAVSFLLPALVGVVLKKYEPGLQSARILLFGSFFYAIGYNIQSFLIAVGKKWQPLPFIAIGMAAAFLASNAMIMRGWGIEGVALGMTAGFICYFVSINLYALRAQMSSREMALHLGLVGLIGAYSAGAVLLVDRFVASGNVVLDFPLRLAAFLILYAPVLVLAQKQTGALALGIDVLKHKFLRRLA